MSKNMYESSQYAVELKMFLKYINYKKKMVKKVMIMKAFML